ncbi:MAG: hypothetical protein F6K54_01540 [Okeania sp. SIO3B5]|uniref:hypothetical protein n=1 Tax=Okeania sp. SIO3B5 TaxID=2607811 RepID=UPI0013FECBD2|nr:hypothetical protein [Okeania sp. SIO3B5]NEO51885.1 hypothetical protein [Okeania sp. SIO3B5]
MTQTIVEQLKIGQLCLWHPGVIEVLKQSSDWHPETDLYDLIGMKPHFWAGHSAIIEGSVLPIASFTVITKDGLLAKTEVLALPFPSSIVPSALGQEILARKIREAVHEQIQEGLDTLSEAVKNQPLTHNFSSTFINLEIFRLMQIGQLAES